MANFNNLALTFRGAKALLEAQAGTTLTLSKIGLGSGTTTGNVIELTRMVEPEIMMPISNKIIDSEANHITLVAKMTNEDIDEGFYWRETGLFFKDSEGNDVLFAYACVSEDDQYDYVPAYSDQRYVKHVRIANVVAGEADITITENTGLLYVDILTYEEFLEEYAEHVKTFEEHIGDIGNPHKVTADQVGLGNVPNVSTNNQTPTYTAESTLVRLVSGEKLSAAFAKIAKAVSDLISHLANQSNPHKVTASQLEALTSGDVVDNLESTAANLPLSANQGRQLARARTALITACGSNKSLALSANEVTRIPLDDYTEYRSGIDVDGDSYEFSFSNDDGEIDGGITFKRRGWVLVSGSVYFGGSSGIERTKRCFIKRRYYGSADNVAQWLEEEVCFQAVRDMGIPGGFSTGTKVIYVNDGETLYLDVSSSVDTTCNTAHATTYLTIMYIDNNY